MKNPVAIAGYVLAVFMAFMGVQKFIGDVPIFKIIEENLATQWHFPLPWVDPYFRYLTGGLEIAGAALIVFGKRLEGAGLSLLVILGAIGTHLTVLGISTPMSSAADAEKSPALFIMAVVFAVLAAGVSWFSYKAKS